MAQDYDILIIGSGPGGYVAAIRAAQLGLKAAIIEKTHIGGVCPNWGCIPTKALLRSADVYHAITHAENFGIRVKEVTVDTELLVQRSRAIADQMANGVGYLLKKNKVDTIWGEAKIIGKGVVRVSGVGNAPNDALGQGDYNAKHIIVATGARPRGRAGMEPDGNLIWSSYEAMIPPKIPESLLIVGAGAIGAEFASFFQILGSKVTLVASRPNILPMEDVEISQHVRKRFERQGMTILTRSKVTDLRKGNDSVTATIQSLTGECLTQKFDRVIAAVGVRGNIEGLGLDEMGVNTDDEMIEVDGYARTNVEGIYAIGDVAGPPMLAHKAVHEGIICVEAIAGLNPHPMDKAKIPACTFCTPQVASVGLTEESALEAGREIRVGRFNFNGNGKAVALGEPDGMVKTIFDRDTGELLGAHMVGSEVTEQIQGFVVAMNLETTEQDLINSVFPHPSISETMHESVLDAFDRAIHH